MYKKKYNFNNVTFTLKTDDSRTFENQIKHIKEFYIPNDIDSAYNIDIECIESNVLFLDTLKMLKELKPNVKYQTFENQVHNEYTIGDMKYYLLDAEEYICIKKSSFQYQIITDGSEKTIKWTFRVIREILLRVNEENYALTMHGTALAINDKGVLIIGNKGSGKTSLAIKLLDTFEDIDFLSNDRIFMYDNITPTMEYFPIPIVLAMGTVKNSTNLDKYFKQTKILERRAKIKYNESNNNDKVDIPLLDIPKIYPNDKMLPSSKIDLIVAPNLSKDSVLSIEDLNLKSKKVILNQTCFTPFDFESLRLEWIYKRKISMNDVIEHKIDTISSIINDVPIIKINYSYDTDKEKILRKIKENL